MANSKAELISEIEALNPEINTNGLNVKELENILSELKNQSEPETQEDPETQDFQEGQEDSKPKKGDWVLAKDRAVTSRRGIISGGQSVEAKDLEGGDQAFEDFKKSGHIVRKTDEPKKPRNR